MVGPAYRGPSRGDGGARRVLGGPGRVRPCPPRGHPAKIPIGSEGLEARTVRKPLENKAFPPKCTPGKIVSGGLTAGGICGVRGVGARGPIFICPENKAFGENRHPRAENLWHLGSGHGRKGMPNGAAGHRRGRQAPRRG